MCEHWPLVNVRETKGHVSKGSCTISTHVHCVELGRKLRTIKLSFCRAKLSSKPAGCRTCRKQAVVSAAVYTLGGCAAGECRWGRRSR